MEPQKPAFLDMQTRPPRGFDPFFALEHAAESILVTTANLDRPGPTIVYVNGYFERMTGWSRSEIVGRSPRVLQGPKTDPASYADMRRITRGETWNGQTVNYRKDGSEFALEWSITPLQDPDGAIRHYLAVQRDVTRRVELEREATAALQAKTDFMVMVSHELRTPLHAIIGFGDLLLDDPDPERRRDYLEMLRGSAVGLLGQVDAILGFVSSAGIAPQLEEAAVDLVALVKHCVTLLTPVAAAKQVSIELSHGGPAQLRANARMLESICSNLIGNAVKFTAAGGRVEVALVDEPSAVGLRVRDGGAGMPPDVLAKLGEPFRQGDAGISRSHEGIGLGLSIARRAVELHGGKLRFTSVPGQGTDAVVELPRERLA